MDQRSLHDRSLEFIRSCFHWERAPERDDLLAVAAATPVELRLGRAAAECEECQLTLLALVNLLARLPLPLLVRLSDAGLRRHMPPYRGDRLSDAIAALGQDLGCDLDLAPSTSAGGIGLTVDATWSVQPDGWSGRAHDGVHAHGQHAAGNPVGPYAAACLAGAEVVRAWARAASPSGTVGTRFETEANPSGNTAVNLWRPGTDLLGPPVERCHLPEIDWVSAGAVNQAALAVLAGLPKGHLRGRVVDPKLLDPPDLNRSLLSFEGGLDHPKATVAVDALDASELRPTPGRYPEDVNGPTASFLVCGTDDVRVRPACQRLRPERLVIIATEGPFGRVSWHGPDLGEAICGGCQAVGMDGPTEEGVPTIGPASVAAGVVGAAWVLRLLTDDDTLPRQAGILTTRLGSRFGVEEANPHPRAGCEVCGGRSNLEGRLRVRHHLDHPRDGALARTTGREPD